MKLLRAWPRQPFFGLAISATVGILTADRWPQFSPTLAIVTAALAITAWFSRRSFTVYALVALGFFLPPWREDNRHAGTTLAAFKTILEVSRHRSAVMCDQDAALARGDLQYLWIRQADDAALGGRDEVQRRSRRLAAATMS